MKPDLKKEQKASNARPRYRYSLAAKVFFLSMDLVTGEKITLPKVKLIELLAVIPYRAWETRQYAHDARLSGPGIGAGSAQNYALGPRSSGW
jgi:hypothetical protein